jgi:hypothetical protein
MRTQRARFGGGWGFFWGGLLDAGASTADAEIPTRTQHPSPPLKEIQGAKHLKGLNPCAPLTPQTKVLLEAGVKGADTVVVGPGAAGGPELESDARVLASLMQVGGLGGLGGAQYTARGSGGWWAGVTHAGGGGG